MGPKSRMAHVTISVSSYVPWFVVSLVYLFMDIATNWKEVVLELDTYAERLGYEIITFCNITTS